MQSSSDWCQFFRDNEWTADDLPWDDPYRLTPRELQTIRGAVQQFQLGEGSEGRQLKKRARVFADRSGDDLFMVALQLFIREEQRHSGQLRRFMLRQQIPTLSHHWVDHAFRRLRVLSGLELELRVLVTAETIAVPFYRALAGATRSPLLQALCQRILHDEAGHLRYQSWMLARLEQGRSPRIRALVRGLHRLFVSATCCLVWRQYHSVFRAAGYGFSRLNQEAREAAETLFADFPEPALVSAR